MVSLFSLLFLVSILGRLFSQNFTIFRLLFSSTLLPTGCRAVVHTRFAEYVLTGQHCHFHRADRLRENIFGILVNIIYGHGLLYT